MGFMDTISGAGRGVSEKAKNVSEVNNLKRKILYEEERIVEVFADIGKKYYKNPDEDPAVLKALCEDIDTRRRRIKKMRFELNSIRGYKICPKCDAEVNEKFQFCDCPIGTMRISHPSRPTITTPRATASSTQTRSRAIDSWTVGEADSRIA